MSDEGSNSEARMSGPDTDSMDVLEENGSVVSGVKEPPPIEDVIEMDELQGGHQRGSEKHCRPLMR